MSIKINIHQAKANLSKYLDRLAKGEKITLCKRNQPIAVILGIPPEPKKIKINLGFARGRFTLDESFFDPLPEEILSGFEGK